MQPLLTAILGKHCESELYSKKKNLNTNLTISIYLIAHLIIGRCALTFIYIPSSWTFM